MDDNPLQRAARAHAGDNQPSVSQLFDAEHVYVELTHRGDQLRVHQHDGGRWVHAYSAPENLPAAAYSKVSPDFDDLEDVEDYSPSCMPGARVRVLTPADAGIILDSEFDHERVIARPLHPTHPPSPDSGCSTPPKCRG